MRALLPVLSVLGCTDLLTPAAPELVVTVLYFDNHTGDDQLDVLGKGIADMMVTDLTQVDGLVVVERERLQEVVAELERQQTKFFDPATAGEIGRLVGATHSITGAINAWEPDIRLDMRLVDVETAAVTVSGQVTGPRDKFFDLQQDLSEKFITDLSPRLTPPPAPSGVDDAALVLEYARGLDQLDRGELGTAYQILEDLVKRAPRFGLAARRRDEVGGQIRKARERREGLLGEAHRELLANADAVLAGDVTTLGDRGAARWFGYRQVRGWLFLQAAESLVKPPLLGNQKTVPRADRIAFVAMLREVVDNQLKYNAEVRAYFAKRRRLPMTASLPDEDEARARTVGATFSRILPKPDGMAMDLAKQICLGRILGVGLFGTNPTPVAIDAGLGESVLAELDRSMEDAETFQRLHHERQTVRMLDHKADCLIALGRRDEAVATWQSALDRFPTSGEYDRVEQKLLEHHRR